MIHQTLEKYRHQIDEFIVNNLDEDADLLGHLITLRNKNSLNALEEAIEIISNN